MVAPCGGEHTNIHTYKIYSITKRGGYLGINEYLGELYVQTNRIKLAKKRLDVLEGCNCEEYEELKELIENN